MKQRQQWIAVTTLIAILFAIWSIVIEPGLLVQTNENVRKWPGPNLRIAFFSDLHAGSPHIDEDYIKKLVDRINDLKPDIIMIGGDLVINGILGGKYMPIDKVASVLKNLSAPLGKYVVLGNHDWWNDGLTIKNVLELNGFSVLENQSTLIHMNSNFKFWLVGIGDAFTQHVDITKALKDVTPEAPAILFMHDPAALFQIKSKFFLALAGHMHGGQVFVPGLGAISTPGAAPKSWAQGWVDFKLGSLFVSRGIGTSILPIRLNAVPEFVILDLKN